MPETEPSQSQGEKVSYNSRAVLLGLFVLVGFILAIYTYSVNVLPSSEQSWRLNTVFIAAISGALALGGTLISQLWGKKTDIIEPSIYATTPSDTATGIALDTPISASFNMLMDKSTFTPTSFTLKDSKNANVSGTISVEGGNAILKPENSLNAGTKYTAKITKDVKSMTGDSLKKDMEWSFTTISA
ncbi:MAG TPA: Ig-like domain-containing protein [Nitrososphaeraceae archaeon]